MILEKLAIEFLNDLIRLYFEESYEDWALRGKKVRYALNCFINAVERLGLENPKEAPPEKLIDLTDALSEIMSLYSPGDPSPQDGLFGDEEFREIMDQIKTGLGKYRQSKEMVDILPPKYRHFFEK